jgi:hypothetical protein
MSKNKVSLRANRLGERWRRSLACHGKEIAEAEIEFDIKHLNRAIRDSEIMYPELTIEEHQSLYQVLEKMKATVFVKKRRAKSTVSFRISDDARFKLEGMAERGGVTMTDVVENLIQSASKFQFDVPEVE